MGLILAIAFIGFPAAGLLGLFDPEERRRKWQIAKWLCTGRGLERPKLLSPDQCRACEALLLVGARHPLGHDANCCYACGTKVQAEIDALWDFSQLREPVPTATCTIEGSADTARVDGKRVELGGGTGGSVSAVWNICIFCREGYSCVTCENERYRRLDFPL